MSVKKNFIYNSILTASRYIFPLLVFPYVTRVLGVDNIGLCNFYTSVINYFIMLAMMGVGTVGLREIAKTKHDKNLLNQTYSSILTINLLATAISLLLLIVLTFLVSKFQRNSILMCIGAAQVFFNTFLIEWLYKGLEEFKYITIRTIFVNIFYTSSVFLLVRSKADYVIYYALTSFVVVINSVVNIIHSRHYVHFSIKNLILKPFIKPFLILGLYSFLTSMYTSFNVMYLGFVSNDAEVGYYTTAIKMYGAVIAFFTAFTGVMMPRLSTLIGTDNKDEFNALIEKSFAILIAIAIPLILYSEAFAPQIIRLIAGPGYEGAIIPMRLLVPLMLVIGYEQITVMQILMPLGKDKAVFANAMIGAIVGIILNIILVPAYKSIGTSLVWISSEFAVLLSSQYFANKYTGLTFPTKMLTSHILWLLPVFFINYLLALININYIAQMMIGLIITILYSFVIEYFVTKNALVRSYTNYYYHKWKKQSL